MIQGKQTVKEVAPVLPIQPETVFLNLPKRESKIGYLKSLTRIADFRLILWNVWLVALSPVFLILKLRRYAKKRNNHEFDMDRWFLPTPSEAAKDQERLVFVGASFGEILLIDPLTKQLKQERPNLAITWVIRDRHTFEELKNHKPGQRVVHWPFDFYFPVAKWLRQENPHHVVFVERYSFPNMVVGAKKIGAKVALINGRSKDVEKSGRLMGSYYRWLFSKFDTMCFQNMNYVERVRALCPAGFEPFSTGNIKLDLKNPVLDPEKEAEIRAWLKVEDELPILAAGSSNNDEEDKFIVDAFLKVRAQIPCRLLFAPRKLQRLPSILKSMGDTGLTVSMRTKREGPADVMMLDTIGELAFTYGLCNAAYVGGSLNGMGHNIIEPIQYGIPVSYGPMRGHFEELQRACERVGIGFRLRNSDELACHWLQVLGDNDFLEEKREAAHSLLNAQKGAMDRTLTCMLSYLDR